MSKAVRIRQHLYDEIEQLARAERRSLIAQLEVLLEQALKMEGLLSEREAPEALPDTRRDPSAVSTSRSESGHDVKTDWKK